MSISCKEIKSFPYTYLEELIKNEDYALLYQYGPYLAMDCNISKYINLVSYDKKPLLRMLFDIANIIRDVNYELNCNTKEVSMGYAKRFLADKLKTLPINSEYSLYTTSVKLVCERYLEEIRKYQYENKLLESALLNFNPIVPYSGIIRKPGLTEAFYNIDTITEKTNLNVVISLLNKSNEEIEKFIKTVFICCIHDILSNSYNFIDSDNYFNEYNIREDNLEKKLSSSVITMLSPEFPLDLVIVYFVLVYLYYNFNRDEYPEIIDTLTSLNKVYEKKVNVQTAMEIMSKFDLPPVCESVLDIDITENMEFENDKRLSQLMDMADLDFEDFKSKHFNLDKLLSYIYNSRRYKTNEYTNSLFLNDNNSIRGYSYIENGAEMLLVCEIDDESLCIPVIDIADNYKMKLVTLDKENNIEVTTNFKS